MEINVVTDPDIIREIVPVIRSAWGMEDLEQLVKDMVAAMRFHGGLVLLAHDGGKPIGMHFSFPGYRNGRVYLYSHMTGVVHQDKYQGVGRALKLAQQEWARSHGYNLIAWTFDPLMALNANFNINKLGVFSRTYLRNFYGSMEDSLNFGLPTDRIVAEWWSDYSRPKMAEPRKFLNSPDAPENVDMNTLERNLGLHIPKDFVSLKKDSPERGMAIRMSLREAFEKLLGNDYTITGFNREKSFYTFTRDFTQARNYGRNIFLD